MNNYSKANGTEIEKTIKGQMQAELSGAGMYFALARAAKEQNMKDVADEFTKLANEHAAQAAFYSEFCGRYPFKKEELWQFVKGLSKAEYCGEKAILGLSDKVKESGFTEASEVLKTFAAQHRHHAEVTSELVEKYAPDDVKQNIKKRYVCSICGFEYEGDMDSEPNDYTCPICGMPKSVFKQK
ncbi:MAG: rubrerythrin [Alphaproteobacteria bacterium]|nr:rubrerythrin [Alphaproteobacteria bacterium]